MTNLATDSLITRYQDEQLSRRQWQKGISELEVWSDEQLSEIKEIPVSETELLAQKTAEHKLTLTELHSLYAAYPDYQVEAKPTVSCNLLLDQLTTAATYRQLQAALKAVKESGYKVECRLNDSKVTLEGIAQNLISDWYKLAPEPKPAKKQRKASAKAEKALAVLTTFPDVNTGRYSAGKAEPMYKHLQACGWRWRADLKAWTHKATNKIVG